MKAANKNNKNTKNTSNEDGSPYSIDDVLAYKSVASTTAARETSTRRNISSSIERTDRFKNIEDGLIPYSSGVKINNRSGVTVKDAIELCQKAYYNFSVFRNTIDLMTEFSVSDINFKGGNAKSRSFFDAFFKKINLWNLQDQFFREYFRSGNVFLYRFDTKLKQQDVSRIVQLFGSSKSSYAAKQYKLPIRYVILNPADIQIEGTINFGIPTYYKLLNDYELQRLRFPQTEEDKEFLDSLPDNVKDQIIKKFNIQIWFPLNREKMQAVFYKKQDYEPFSVPMGYPVLEDINFKYEMKKMDMAVARCMQQAVLLVTTGTEPEKGGINNKNLIALQRLFENQSVGRVLVADYTTKVQFVIPQISDLLDPKKYEIFDRDINIGLNNVFAGGEKYANQTAKIEVFVARLKQARQAFLQNFLYPEIKRISREMGFKSYPTPILQEIDLKDNGTYAKVYTRLAELGILTPKELLEAIETHNLPEQSSSIESQREFTGFRKEGLYQPLIGAPSVAPTDGKDDEPEIPGNSLHNSGRPSGTTGIPKSKETVSPIGNNSNAKYSLSKVKENMIKAGSLESEVVKSYKKKSKIRKLSEKDDFIIDQIVKTIIANEAPDKWNENINFYLDNPIDKNSNRVSEITDIAATHGLDFYLASILYNSIKDA